MPLEPRIEFVEDEKLNLAGYTLIEGFPGMGLIGTIAAKYLVERHGDKKHGKFGRAGYIDANFFAPVIRVHHGEPINPARIYVDEKHKLVVLIAEQVIPKVYANAMARAVVDWVKKKKIKTVIALSGIHTDEPGGDKLYGIATNEAGRKLLEKHKVEVIADGITTGVTALILLGLKNSSVRACSMMGNVRLAADYKGAANLVEKLDEMFGLSIGVKPLLDEARATEKQLIEQMQKVKEVEDSAEQFSGDQTPMYT